MDYLYHYKIADKVESFGYYWEQFVDYDDY